MQHLVTSNSKIKSKIARKTGVLKFCLWSSPGLEAVILPRRRDAQRLSSIGNWQSRSQPTTYGSRRLGLDDFTYYKKTLVLSLASKLPRRRRPPRSGSCSMLDDYTLKVSFLAGFLVVVSFFISWYVRGDPMVRPFHSYICHFLTMLHRFQLDAITTIGFSDPILSYLSALQFYFNGVPMLKEGYEKVICLTPYVPFLVLN
jgi:hypothetical protein